jgi:hypothetical protein
MVHVQLSEVQFHSLIPSLFMIMVGENLKTDPSVLRVRVIKFYSCVLHKYCTMCWDYYSKYLHILEQPNPCDMIEWKWKGGALAPDGVIYCIPYKVTQILAIDPFKEFSATLQTNMPLYPDELGRLFLKNEECDETFFESSFRKFGGAKVFKIIEKCLPLDAEWDGAYNNGNLPPFMVAASCENCTASVIYYLLRRNVNGFLGNI